MPTARPMTTTATNAHRRVRSEGITVLTVDAPITFKTLAYSAIDDRSLAADSTGER
jgi:hypothetical protein